MTLRLVADNRQPVSESPEGLSRRFRELGLVLQRLWLRRPKTANVLEDLIWECATDGRKQRERK